MIKALFIDYTGTTVKNGGFELLEFGRIVVENSRYSDLKIFLKEWYELWKTYEETCYKDTYKPADEILDICIDILVKDYNLNYDLNELKDLVHGFWINAPLFEDALELFNNIKLPLYILTNNGIKYIDESMKRKNLYPTGIISADEIKAYKPHIDLFNYALRVAGCKASEVIHIGDSLNADYYGATNAGIIAYLVVRKEDNNISKDVRVIKRLTDILEIIDQ